MASRKDNSIIDELGILRCAFSDKVGQNPDDPAGIYAQKMIEYIDGLEQIEKGFSINAKFAHTRPYVCEEVINA